MYDEGKETLEGERHRQVDYARSNPTRVAILDLLVKHEALTAEQVRGMLPDNPPLLNVVYHLKTLESCGLVGVGEGCYKLS